MSQTNYTTLLLSDYSKFNFKDTEYSKKPFDKKEYIPIFGVGTIDETMAWARNARRIKFTINAIKYYNIPDDVVNSNIENPRQNNFYYNENKPYYEFLIGKTVGIIRRIMQNGTKIDLYNCPKYELLEINNPYRYDMCTAKVKNINDGSISEDINISRIAIPELCEYIMTI